jgi:solute carrier family 25 iron transporter 28/37
VYFGTYELVKDLAGGNVDDGHHPLAAGELRPREFEDKGYKRYPETNDANIFVKAVSGACATIASDALMNPFDGTISCKKPVETALY